MADKTEFAGKRRVSAEPRVVEYLFTQRWDEATKTLSNPVVTLEDVSNAIVETGVDLSTRNTANFFKDFVRVTGRANKNFPQSVLSCGYTAIQTPGFGRCFTFVPLGVDSKEAFSAAIVPSTSELERPHKVESVSMPAASRRLGREEEAWIVQVAVRLRIVETHFALFSALQPMQVDHLQNSVKLRRAEVDALFLAQQGNSATGQIEREVLVCCEVRGTRDDILESQILGQLKNLATDQKIRQDFIQPVALKALSHPNRSLIQVVEFEMIEKTKVADLTSLSVVSQNVYELVPAVPGVGRIRSTKAKTGFPRLDVSSAAEQYGTA